MGHWKGHARAILVQGQETPRAKGKARLTGPGNATCGKTDHWMDREHCKFCQVDWRYKGPVEDAQQVLFGDGAGTAGDTGGKQGTQWMAPNGWKIKGTEGITELGRVANSPAGAGVGNPTATCRMLQVKGGKVGSKRSNHMPV